MEMNLIQIGKFIAELRKEQGLTQEQFGKKLGVTNKTVSRWETGSYLPSVDALLCMSEMFSISINEILSGERLNKEEYQKRAEENIKSVLSVSAFTLKERCEYFEKKWKKEHLFENIIYATIIVGMIIYGLFTDNGLHLVGLILAIIWIIVQRNRMSAFVEKCAYDGTGS